MNETERREWLVSLRVGDIIAVQVTFSTERRVGKVTSIDKNVAWHRTPDEVYDQIDTEGNNPSFMAQFDQKTGVGVGMRLTLEPPTDAERESYIVEHIDGSKLSAQVRGAIVWLLEGGTG